MANYRRDRSILVHETQYHGKGSAGYADGQFINTGWWLAQVHLKATEDFRWQCHEDRGGVQRAHSVAALE